LGFVLIPYKVDIKLIQHRIYELRGQRIMLDLNGYQLLYIRTTFRYIPYIPKNAKTKTLVGSAGFMNKEQIRILNQV